MHVVVNACCTFGAIFLGVAIYLFSDIQEIKFESTKGKKHDLVVGILSSRSNFLNREIIRKHLQNGDSRVFFRFIVGKDACQIPVEDRIDPFECYPNPDVSPLDKEEMYSSHSIDGNRVLALPKFLEHAKIFGYDFKVNKDVEIKDLGVHKSYLKQENFAVTVALYNTITQKIVVSSTFVPFSKGTLKSQYFIKHVESLTLNKGFRGSLVVSGFSNYESRYRSDAVSAVTIRNGLIEFIKGFRYGYDVMEFAQHFTSHVNFCFAGPLLAYSVYGKENENATNKTQLYLDYKFALEMENQELKKELEINDDILLVDSLEVYRNIPMKMLLFYQWLSAQMFDFVMKTDDDCYTNISAIMQMLDELKEYGKNNLWIGNFREYFGLDMYGKWAELEYKSTSYPPFACGSGYILSAELVKWIAGNRDYLKTFQGEDTSLGIWLAGLQHTRIHDNRFHCAKDICQKSGEVFTMPELSITEMELLFQNNSERAVVCEKRFT